MNNIIKYVIIPYCDFPKATKIGRTCKELDKFINQSNFHLENFVLSNSLNSNEPCDFSLEKSQATLSKKSKIFLDNELNKNINTTYLISGKILIDKILNCDFFIAKKLNDILTKEETTIQYKGVYSL